MSSKEADPKNQYEKDENLKPDDVEVLVNWTRQQPHLPDITELEAIIFLHSRCYSIEAAKSTIDNFFTIRTMCPEIFRKPLDDPVFKITTDSVALVMLPRPTPEGYRVLIGKLVDTNPDSFHYSTQMQLLDICGLWTLFREGINNGFCFVMDMEGATIGHLAKLNLNTLQKGIHYLQEGAPVKVRGVHFINVVYFLDKIMLLLKRYLKGDLFSTIHVHSKSIDSLHDSIPMDILPKEYGGKAPSTTELKGTYNAKILEDSDFFDYLMSKQVDENLRPGVTKNPNEIFGLEGTFKTLQVD